MRITAYRSILAQILHNHRQDEKLINKFDFVMTEESESSGSIHASMQELWELVRLFLQNSKTFLILDGIDECEDNQLLVKEMIELSESSPTKILLLGRINTESLIRAIPASSQITLARKTVDEDIRLFISAQICLLIRENLLPQSSDPEILVSNLSKGADGMFLWAKLMINYLMLPVHDQSTRLESICNVICPEGLEKKCTQGSWIAYLEMAKRGKILQAESWLGLPIRQGRSLWRNSITW